MAVIRCARFPLLLVVVCAALSLLGQAALAAPPAVLTAGDGDSYEYFGKAVAIDGDTAMVGAPEHSASGKLGAVYVYVLANGVWKFKQELTASDGGYPFTFGYDVALQGGTAVIGSPDVTVGGNELQGAAYVFTRGSDGTWSEKQRLTAGDGAAGDGFGTSVAIDGSTIVAGAPCSPGPRDGAAYVFTLSSGGWGLEKKLTATGLINVQDFGCAVAVSGDHALVGSWKDQNIPNAAQQGSAYVFGRSGGAWTQEAHLYEADGHEADHFGQAVALDGDTALIGVPDGDFGATSGEGYALVYSRSGATWGEAQQLTASDGEGGQMFGTSVALQGDRAVVGMPHLDVGGVKDLGAAYTYVRTDGRWTQNEKLTAPGTEYEYFGTAVALDGEVTVAGAPEQVVDGADKRGAAYVFGTPEPTVTAPTLGAPVCPRVVKRRASFTVSGSLSPRFAAGSKTVVVGAYRAVGSTWKLYKKYPAVNNDTGTASSYSAQVSLPLKGKYKFMATSAATAEWLSASSPWSQVTTVK